MLDTATKNARRLLVVDPCEECRRFLPRLRDSGWMVHSCNLNEAHEWGCDVGLIRLSSSHLELPERLKELILSSGTEWIAVLEAGCDVMAASLGNFVGEWFFDYHTLPFDTDRMNIALGRAFGMAKLRHKGAATDSRTPGHELLGNSHSSKQLRKLIAKLAPTEAPVLIRGESGTGKELVARALHWQSRRNDQPFVAVNCGAIPEHLIQSELFGHEKGAFTGAHQRKIGRIEAANGGTLLFDEIGDLPMSLQTNLLRFLQEMQIERVGSSKCLEVNVRVLAATHINLEEAVERGSFREDLYYRLNVLQIQTTPLRERTCDIPELARHFSRLYSSEIGRRPRHFSEHALAAMIRHPWPGNVRELANRVRRGMALAERRHIEAGDLGLDICPEENMLHGSLDDYVFRAERQALDDVLALHSRNMSLAAKTLGVSRPTFYRLLHKHQIR